MVSKKEKDLDKRVSTLKKEFFGVEKKDENEVEEMEKIFNKLRNIKKKIAPNSNDDIMGFFNTTFQRQNSVDNHLRRANTKRGLANNDDIKGIFEKEVSSSSISSMMLREMGRIKAYDNYEIIVSLIPYLKEILNTYTDNIINPDDFSKKAIRYFVETETTMATEDREASIKVFNKRTKELEKKYAVEEKIRSYIQESLKLGDSFLFIKKIGDSLEELVRKRGYDNYYGNKINEELNILKEDNTGIFQGDTFEKSLSESILIKNFKESDNKKKKDVVSEIKTKLLKIVNKNFVLEDKTLQLFEEDDLKMLATKQNEKLGSTQILSEAEKKQGKEDDEDLKLIKGSVIKKLDPKKVVKLEFNGICYGYYYIENIYRDSSLAYNNFTSISSDIKDIINTAESGNKKDGMAAREKEKFIFNILSDLIVEKIDRKFIVKNKQFKRIILSYLESEDKLKSDGMRILFIPPEEIIHWVPNNEDNVYGDSIFKYIMFFAKIYLITLLTQLMMKITRSADKRLWYIEAGLEKDQEQVISSFINDLKNKEIKMSDFDDVDYVMKSVGQFKDYYMPSFDGDKPVEMETLEGQEADMNNEFLEFLNKFIINGTGVPSSFIESLNEVELAKTLTLQNQKFVRRVLAAQKAFTPALNTFITTLYRNEYEDDTEIEEKKDDSKKNKEVKADDIRCYFLAPISLSMMNMEEEITKAETIAEEMAIMLLPDAVEKVVDGSFLVNDDNRESVRTALKNKIKRELLPNLPWDMGDDYLQEVIKGILDNKEVIKEINKKTAEEEESNLDSEDEEM